MSLSPTAKALISDCLAYSGDCVNHPQDRPKARYLWHTPEGIAVPLCVACEAAWTGDALMGHTDKPLMVEKIGD